MKDRLSRSIAHPFWIAYLGVLVVAEILLFVFVSFEVASDLWFSVLAVWLLTPVLLMVGRAIGRGQYHLSRRNAVRACIYLGFFCAVAALGFVEAFNHHTSTQVMAFTSREAVPETVGLSSDDVLTATSGTRYEVHDPTGGGWDADRFWQTARFNVAYQCQVLNGAAQNYPEIYNCARTSKPVPQTVSAGGLTMTRATLATQTLTSQRANTTALEQDPLSTEYTFGLRTVKVQLQPLAVARLSLYLPTTAKVHVDGESVSVSVPPLNDLEFTVNQDETAQKAVSDGGVRKPESLPGDVIGGTTSTAELLAKSIRGGNLTLVTLPDDQSSQRLYLTVMAKSTGAIITTR